MDGMAGITVDPKESAALSFLGVAARPRRYSTANTDLKAGSVTLSDRSHTSWPS